jgi:hypothetical protein
MEFYYIYCLMPISNLPIMHDQIIGIALVNTRSTCVYVSQKVKIYLFKRQILPNAQLN